MAKEVSNDEKLAIFAKELELIRDPSIREFTKLCLVSAPDYIFADCPASSTGKFHPLDELSWDGTIIHIKKIVTLAFELTRGMDCENTRDEILAACIIHDLIKRGKKNTGHTLKNHPGLAADFVDEIQAATGILTDESYQIIRNCCGYHYGPWSEDKWKKDLSEYTREELLVYLADYVVSKRFVQIDYRR